MNSIHNVLFNFSNHPISSWTENQKKAAHDLGYSILIDFPEGMPLVNAMDTTREVHKLALSIIDNIKNLIGEDDLSGAGAVVAGDYTLTYHLVSLLEEMGVTCYSATTERKCENVTKTDGTVEIKRIFEFGQWRPYNFRSRS